MLLRKGTLVIIPCGRAKVWDKKPAHGRAPAEVAYTGAPFVVNRQYARRFAERWLILSAKYGFIDPDFVIAGPYNVTFKKKSTRPISVPELQNQVKKLELYNYGTVIGLGGREYRDVITQAFAPWPIEVQFPFAGLSIGKGMRAIKEAIACGEPLPKRSE